MSLLERGGRSGTKSRVPTSGVPQKVDVVPLCSMFSLQSPKSVRTMCPCESRRIFSGFKSLWENEKWLHRLISLHDKSPGKTAKGIRTFNPLLLHSQSQKGVFALLAWIRNHPLGWLTC